MLDLAIKHEEELKRKILETRFVEKYKFENATSYFNDLEIKKIFIGWDGFQMVSVDSEGNVIGFFQINLDRDTFNLYGLRILNFSDNKVLFAKDLKNFIMKMVEREDIRKINFEVVIGNPIEKSYDKMMKKYGGRIVGIREKEVKLFDGKIYDLKMYEIFIDEIRQTLRKRDWKEVKI